MSWLRIAEYLVPLIVGVTVPVILTMLRRAFPEFFRQQLDQHPTPAPAPLPAEGNATVDAMEPEEIEAAMTRSRVNRREWGATEADEAETLAALGYTLDSDGIYRHPDDTRGSV